MIYAYDEAILLPVKDLYDSQIMMASINAARDMYEKGEKAIKDFNTEYGDFITPIQKDLEWYNRNVTEGAKNLINNLYAQGIDPTRSTEGRAAISRFINNIPKGDINKLKSSAEVAKEFLKSKLKLEQAGLWNPEFNKYINKGKSLDEWSTAENGIWDIVAATPYEDLTTFSNPQFDQLKPSSWTFEKNGMKYRQEGVREEDLQRVAKENFADLITSPQGSFLYNQLLEKTGNADDAREMFTNMIAGSQTRRLFSSAAQIDPDWFKVQSLNIDKAKLALERERFALAKAKAAQAAQQYNVTPISYTQKVQRSAQENTKKAIVERLYNVQGSAKRIADYFKSMYDSTTNKQRKEQYSKAYNKWQNVQKALSTAKKEDVDKLLQKYLITDKNGNFTEGYSKWVSKAYSTDAKSNNTYGDIDRLYSIYKGNVGGISSDLTAKILADSKDKEKYPEGLGSYYTVSFGSGGGVRTSRVRRSQVTGRGFTSNSISNLFDSWANKNNLRGYLVNRNAQPYYIGRGSGELDISGTISIPLSEFDKFLVDNPKIGTRNADGTKTDKYAKRRINATNALGFIIKDYLGKEYKSDDEMKSDTKYTVHIPITKTIINNGTNFADIDTEEDKMTGGASIAAKRQLIRLISNLKR